MLRLWQSLPYFYCCEAYGRLMCANLFLFSAFVGLICEQPSMFAFSEHIASNFFLYCFFFIVSASSCPPLGRTRSRGKCWAAVRLSRHLEPSGHALLGEIDGLNNEGQYGQRSVYCLSFIVHLTLCDQNLNRCF